MFDIFGMRHRGLHSLLSSYVDGQVTDAEAERVERHLAVCEEGRVELESLRATVGLLRSLPELAASRSFRLTEIPEARSEWQPGAGPFAYTRPLMAAASVAAVLLIALVAVDIAGVGGSPVGTVASDRATSVMAESVTEAGVAAEAPVAGEAPVAAESDGPVAEAAIEQVQIEMAVVEEMEEIEEVQSEKIAEIEVARVLESESESEPEIAQIAEITEEQTDTQIQAEALLPESLPFGTDDDAPFVADAASGGADIEAAFGAEPGDDGFPYLPLEIAAGALLALLVAGLLVVRRRRA